MFSRAKSVGGLARMAEESKLSVAHSRPSEPVAVEVMRSGAPECTMFVPSPMSLGGGLRVHALGRPLEAKEQDEDPVETATAELIRHVTGQTALASLSNLDNRACAGEENALLGECKRLIEQGADVMASHQSCPLLHWACYSFNADLASLLLSSGADPDALNPLHETALHWASSRGALACVEVLATKGADLELPTRDGSSAAHLAARNGHTLLLDLLRHHGANLNQLDRRQSTPLHEALRMQLHTTARQLVAWGVRLDLQDVKKRNALHLAVKNDAIAVVQAMIARAPSSVFLQRNHDDETPRDGATTTRMQREFKSVDALNQRLLPPSHSPSSVQRSRSRLQRLGDAFCYGNRQADYYCSAWVLLSIFATCALFGFVVSPKVRHQVPLGITVVTWTAAALSLVTWFLSAITDPGYLDASACDVWDPAYVAWLKRGTSHAVCSVCRIAKTLRAKHCRLCQRCVDRFDHHCPWVFNCVGAGNYRYFFAFLASTSVSLLLCLVLNFVYLVHRSVEGWRVAVVLTTLNCAALLLFCGGMFVMHCKLMLQGITTYEHLCYSKYEYLTDGEGDFFNPFSLGCWGNLLVFLCVCFNRPRRSAVQTSHGYRELNQRHPQQGCIPREIVLTAEDVRGFVACACLTVCRFSSTPTGENTSSHAPRTRPLGTADCTKPTRTLVQSL